MTRDAWMALWLRLCTAFPRGRPSDANLWWELFGSGPEGPFRDAVEEALRTYDRFPSIAQVQRLLGAARIARDPSGLGSPGDARELERSRAAGRSERAEWFAAMSEGEQAAAMARARGYGARVGLCECVPLYRGRAAAAEPGCPICYGRGVRDEPGIAAPGARAMDAWSADHCGPVRTRAIWEDLQ